MATDKINVSFYITKELNERLEKYIEESTSNKSKVVARALTEYLDKINA